MPLFDGDIKKNGLSIGIGIGIGMGLNLGHEEAFHIIASEFFVQCVEEMLNAPKNKTFDSKAKGLDTNEQTD